jgi:hypothetical protein
MKTRIVLRGRNAPGNNADDLQFIHSNIYFKYCDLPHLSGY